MFWFASLGIVLLASFIRCLSGFGFSLVLVPLLGLFWDVRAAVATAAIIGTLLSLTVAIRERRHADWRLVLVLLLGTLLGQPLGLQMLMALDPAWIKVIVGGLVVLLSLALFRAQQRGWAGGGRRERGSLVAAGFLSGLLHGSVSMGGPPIVLFLLRQGTTREKFYSTFAAHSLPSGLISITMFAASGIITPEVVKVNLVLLPAAVVGFWISQLALRRVDARSFRALALGLVILTGLISLFTGATEILRGM